MKSLSEVIKEKKSGLFFGNRILLPFSCHILKLNIENDLITDFSPSHKRVHVSENPDFMEMYFYDYKDISEYISKYEAIKLIVVEKGKDVFNTKNHITLALHPEENHHLRIEKLGENQIFIE